jgi:hypothetical protein
MNGSEGASHAGSHLAGNHAAGHTASHASHHAASNHLANGHSNHLSSNHASHHATDAGHGDKALTANPTKPAISQATSGMDGAKVSSTPVELKAVAKSLPGIEIYQDGTASSATDLGT